MMWFHYLSLSISIIIHFFTFSGDGAVVGTNTNVQAEIGQCSFKEFVDTAYPLVDKSRLIKEILEHPSEVLLVCRPRRFGKSTNLSMLKHFLTTEDNTTKLFERFAISQEKEFCKRWQNKYPTIHINLNELSVATSLKESIEEIQSIVREAYLAHSYIEFSEVLSKPQKKIYKSYVYGTDFGKSEVKASLKYLIKLINKHHKEKVVVLIDEYDTPLVNAHIHGFYDHLVQFLSSFMELTFKGNQAVKKAVLFGVTRVSKESLFPTMNKIYSSTVFDDLFSTYFGVTESEMVELLDVFKLDKDKSLQDMTNHYKGYTIGGNIIYNPVSLISYLSSGGVLKDYWLLSGCYDEFHSLLTEYGFLPLIKAEALVDGIPIDQIFREDFVITDLVKDENAYWTLLTHLGYLTAKTITRSKTSVVCELQIPNAEIKGDYERVLNESAGDFISGKQLIRSVQYQNSTEALNVLTSYLSLSQQFLRGEDPLGMVGDLLTKVFQVQYALTIDKERRGNNYITRLRNSRIMSEIIIVVTQCEKKTKDLDETSVKSLIQKMLKGSFKTIRKGKVKYIVVTLLKRSPYNVIIF